MRMEAILAKTAGCKEIFNQVMFLQRLAKSIRPPGDEDDEVARMEAAAKMVGERKMAAMRRGAERSPGRPPPPSLK